MRRRSGRRNWIAFKGATDRFSGACGDALLRQFECHDLLEVTDDRQLMEWRPRCAADVRLMQEMSRGSDGWRAVSSRLSIVDGWVYSCRTEPAVAEAIALCDGQRRLGAIVKDLATRREVDGQKMASALCPILRELIEFGLLVVERDAGGDASQR